MKIEIYKNRVQDEIKSCQYDFWHSTELSEEIENFKTKDFGNDFDQLIEEDDEITEKEAKTLKQIYIDMHLQAINCELENCEEFQKNYARSEYYDNERKEM